MDKVGMGVRYHVLFVRKLELVGDILEILLLLL
jgi:hypothetical protein